MLRRGTNLQLAKIVSGQEPIKFPVICALVYIRFEVHAT